MAKIRGCHLVGSTGLQNTEMSFRQCLSSMPDRLRRVPDGETGARDYFVRFQGSFFSAVPEILNQFDSASSHAVNVTSNGSTTAQIAEAVEKLRQSKPETGYDTAAIESYEVFKHMREQGVIPRDVRFQVCLPGIANVLIPFVQPDFQAAVEPVYEEALFRAMRNIQDQIPHEDLAIQIDLAMETGLWEDVYPPWFCKDDMDSDKRKNYIVDFIIRMFEQVEQDVELGVHNCYGDREHRHFMEPRSLAGVTERGLALFEKSPHPIQFWHVPVPLSAMDNLDEYYEPTRDLLSRFKKHGTEVYLGVVQPDDQEGIQKRIDAARKILPGLEFGIATECGLGRTPKDEIDGIMRLSVQLSAPIQQHFKTRSANGAPAK